MTIESHQWRGLWSSVDIWSQFCIFSKSSSVLLRNTQKHSYTTSMVHIGLPEPLRPDGRMERCKILFSATSVTHIGGSLRSLRKFHASDNLAFYFHSISNCKMILSTVKAETDHRAHNTTLFLLGQVLFYRGWMARAFSVFQGLKSGHI